MKHESVTCEKVLIARCLAVKCFLASERTTDKHQCIARQVIGNESTSHFAEVYEHYIVMCSYDVAFVNGLLND